LITTKTNETIISVVQTINISITFHSHISI